MTQADRAAAYLLMASMLGKRGGFDADDPDGWQRRAAFISGIEHGSMYAADALGGRPLTELQPTLQDALRRLDAFLVQRFDTLERISQHEIDAVTAAAATLAELLRPAIENLKSQ